MEWGDTRVSNGVWQIAGYYGRVVSAQANAEGLLNEGGIFDIYDVTDPHNAVKKTGYVGAIGMRYALYYVANHGLGGHAYRIIARRDVVNGERQARSFLVRL